MPKKYFNIGCTVIIVTLIGLFLKNNAPANNYKNPDTLNIQDKQSMMMADKAVEKIARGTSGKFETLYLGADGQFQWNILNPEETSFFDEDGKAIKSILLISTKLQTSTPFDQESNRYETSTLRQAEIALASQTLSPKEAEVIFNTTQPGGDVVTVTSYSFIESQLFGDKFFAPTAKIMNSNSCGLEDRHYRQEGNYYWLSAAAKDDPKLAGYISKCGVFAQLDITVEHLSARATANLDPHAVLFFAAAQGGKVSGVVGSKAMQDVEHQELLSDYRLTLKDASQTLVVSDQVKENNKISFNYNAQGDGDLLSAVIIDKTQNEIVSYGQLADISVTKMGVALIELPKKYDHDNYQIKVFSEQYNGDYKTDYASELVDLKIE